MDDSTDETILIVSGTSAEPKKSPEYTLTSNRVPIVAVKNSLNRFLGSFADIIETVRSRTEGIRVEEMEVNLAVETDGSVGLLGTGASVGASCSIMLRINLRRENAPK